MPIPAPSLLPIDQIKLHPDLQVRGGTNPTTVKSYARAMSAGESFPAITLAQVGGNLYVIDGHHRYEAARQAKLPTLLATKRRMSLAEAVGEAFASNGKHGRGLKRHEKLHAFNHFLELGRHLDEFNAVLPLRQIAHAFPAYSFQHIGKLLKERGIHAPRAGVKPYRYGLEPDEPTDDDLELEQSSLLAGFRHHLDLAMASYSLLDASLQSVALRDLRHLVRSLEPPANSTEPGFVPAFEI